MMRVLLLAVLAALLAPVAEASRCHAFAERGPMRLAGLGDMAAEAQAVDIMFVGHSTFRIETQGGVVIATDYAGAAGPGRVPDIVTMNHAHSTHWTPNPDPGIDHVLRGWNPEGPEPAEHRLELADVLVRNVTTDIRGGWAPAEADGNSIFVFEVADLCIAHLGHLHHPLDERDYAALGRIDILMVPVDGSYTMAVDQMAEIARRLKSALVLPMHFFGQGSLTRFLQRLSSEFRVREHQGDVLRVSVESLPAEPTVLTLPTRALHHARESAPHGVSAAPGRAVPRRRHRAGTATDSQAVSCVWVRYCQYGRTANNKKKGSCPCRSISPVCSAPCNGVSTGVSRT